jgi:MarR family transcriptional regulator for hemolysin
VRPPELPIGLRLSRAARVVSRAFDDALGEAGGSLPTWLVLLNLKTRRLGNQRELAEAVGIQEATLTAHLNGMEANGLLTRSRDPGNRRVHIVELTDAGETAFLRLREAAVAFDRRLRAGMTNADLAQLAELLDRLSTNVRAEDMEAPGWADLARRAPGGAPGQTMR